MEDLGADLVARLGEEELTVATAESLTGGLLAVVFTALPGSSKTYVGGVVSYATEVKVDVLGVPQDVVDEHGVVSGECAAAMASGVRRLLGTDFAISTTGVAGPDRQEDKPVGTAYVAVAGPAGVDVVDLDLDGDRETIQHLVVEAALRALQSALTAVSAVSGIVSRHKEEPGLG